MLVSAPRFYYQLRTGSGPSTDSDKMADKGQKGKKNKGAAVVVEPASSSKRPKKAHPSPSGGSHDGSSSKDTGGVQVLKRFFSTQPKKQQRGMREYFYTACSITVREDN